MNCLLLDGFWWTCLYCWIFVVAQNSLSSALPKQSHRCKVESHCLPNSLLFLSAIRLDSLLKLAVFKTCAIHCQWNTSLKKAQTVIHCKPKKASYREDVVINGLASQALSHHFVSKDAGIACHGLVNNETSWVIHCQWEHTRCSCREDMAINGLASWVGPCCWMHP